MIKKLRLLTIALAIITVVLIKPVPANADVCIGSWCGFIGTLYTTVDGVKACKDSNQWQCATVYRRT